MTLLITRQASPDEQARAAARQAEDARLNKASIEYREQIAFAIKCRLDSDDYKAEPPAVRDAIYHALRKVERTLTLCGVQPIVQHYEKALRGEKP